MKRNVDYIAKINSLLSRKGINDRKYASTIASILGLQYNSAKQKLDGKRGITFKEVKSVFNYFNESFEGVRNYNCIFILNNIHKRCNIDVDTEVTIQKEDNQTYAVKRDELFLINTNSGKIESEEFYKVNSIDFLPPPKIAILDNNNNILDLLKKICERYGIAADTFTNKEDILVGIENHHYEIYVLDWLLDFNSTSESLIMRIREEVDSEIIILTGQLDHYESNIGKMILKYNVKLIEKPAKPFIISSILLSSLFFN